MGRTIAAVALAAIAAYVFGFLYWGATSVPYTPWHETRNDGAAGLALLEHFRESGVYYIPGNSNPAEERSRLFESGPTGFVILDVDGRPMVDTGIMVRGFLLNLLIFAIAAALLRSVWSAVPSFGARLRLVALTGFAAVVLIHFGDAVWWALPWGWEISKSIYSFSAWLIGGAVLSAVMRPDV